MTKIKKEQKDKQRSTKYQKTKDRATRTPLNIRGEPMFSGRMGLEEIISKDEKAVDGYHVIHILLQTQRIQVMSKSKDL